MRTPTALRPAIIPLAFILLFVALGVVFLRYAGFEDDEALIVSGSYTREGFAYVVRLGSYRVPLMLMSYVGALKSCIYAAVFSLWQPSVFSVRVPALLLGGLTIWIVYRMLWTLAGQRAALIGSVLLSTDTTFLLTTCFDWGPVVLQHLLLASGLLNLIYFDKFRKQGHLAAGVFFFGLAVWDKALFAWILGGMTVAALVSFPRKVFDSITMRNLSIAGLSFCLGSAPLIAYNLSSPMATLRTTTAFSTDSFAEKKANLYSAFSGKALFGYLVRNDARGFSNKPKNALETGSVRLSKAFNHPVSGFGGHITLLALIITPFLQSSHSRRINLFVFVTMFAAWGQMAVTKGAGNSAHHVILLWPFPAVLTAVALAESAEMLRKLGRRLLLTLLLFLTVTNLLVMNEYLTRFITNGPGLVWTDAIDGLSAHLQRNRFGTIYLNDWGILDGLWLLSRGRLPLYVGSDPLTKPSLDANDRKTILARTSDPRAVFVSHTQEDELFKGVGLRLSNVASEALYKRETLDLLTDRNGRVIFEVFRFAP